MSGQKIFPRNLTARAARQVSGNPDISRPEDSLANCFPGLDADVRTLDRRFFPGLVFEYVFEPERRGAMLLYSDPRADPDLRPEYTAGLEALDPAFCWVEPLRAQLFEQLTGLENKLTDADGPWHLDSIEQHGNRIDLSSVRADGTLDWFSGPLVWRLVRGLEPGEVIIRLLRRSTGDPIEVKGWRRLFTDPGTGVLSLAYQPGELQMSLCSPWQHDFRDCACHYWSSNRPDVVHGEVNPAQLEDSPELGDVRLDWMRADRSPAAAAAALSTMRANRPFQMDHFQINHAWQDLSVVINNTETDSIFQPQLLRNSTPYATPLELYEAIRDELAPLEMTLALEYLYAYFSIETKLDPNWPDLADHTKFIRLALLEIAVGEMHHLRSANELLWKLTQIIPGLPPYVPVLDPSHIKVPNGTANGRDPLLRRLTPDVLEDFITIEKPSGTINGAYACAIATLQQPEYQTLSELAGRIVNDGVEHFARFRDIRSMLRVYGKQQPYLRPIQLGTRAQASAALQAFDDIKRNLTEAYRELAQGNFAPAAPSLAAGRAAMEALLQEGDALASKGIGIPFW